MPRQVSSDDVIQAFGFGFERNDFISYTAQTVQIRVTSGAEIIYGPSGDPARDATLIKCRM